MIKMQRVVTLLMLGALCLTGTAQAQTDTYTASGTWTAPAGVTSVTVEAWGGGGAGGGNPTNRDGAGGGGGGAYSKNTAIAVTPGNVYTVTVGAGGAGVIGASGGAGGDSWFATAGTILAKGGAGGEPPVGGNGGVGGAGGAAAAGIGTSKFSGGDGGAGLDDNTGEGGPGGSSAGTAANGTSGSNPWSTATAGAPPAGGGIGGDGDTNTDGNAPASGNGGGGGGSGDRSGPGGDRAGGNGADGKVEITYTSSSGSVTAGPTLCVSDPGNGGTYAWGGLTNVGVQDNVYASADGFNSSITEYLKCTGYGFSIPAGATIDGITVGVWDYSIRTMSDQSMVLVKANVNQTGSPGTMDLATQTRFSGTNSEVIYGGATNLWGNTWTSADINSATFGAAFAAVRGPYYTTDTAYVDYMPITVDYTLPAFPTVSSINRASNNPTNPATSVSWTVTFSASVTGVDTTDFALVTGGSVSGASITSVTGSGTTWTVTANTGSGYGSLGLNLVDDDSIVDGGGKKLGGTGVGNGDFTGQVYTIPAPATVSSINRASSNPTFPAASVSWTVTFSASVSGVDAADFALVQAGGASGASLTSVSGSGTSWTVTANTGSGTGTLGLNLVDNDSIIDGSGTPLGGTGAGNGNFTGQVYTISPEPVLAEYRMDAASWNGTANEVVDSSGNGNNAQSFNSANTDGITPAIAGSPGTCSYGVFDNGSTITSGYIQTPLPDLTTDFTVTAWIRTTNNAPSGQRILIDDQNNTGGYGISLGDGSAGKVRFYTRAINPVILDSNYTIANNTWYFVSAVADITNGIRTIYVFNSAGVLQDSTSDASAFTGTWGTDAGPVSIGGETNASGEATASFHFHGNLDEVRVYQKALSQSALAAIAAQTHACAIGGPDHFAIAHDGSGVNCQSEPVTISAHATDHSVDAGYTGTLNVSTSTGHGDWTVITGLGALNNGAADDGAASYNMVAGDNGVVVLGLKDPHVETLNINVSDGVVSETSGAALASEDQNLAFAQTGFVFLADSVTSNIGTQIAAKSSAVSPGAQLLELQAIRTSDTTGACEAALQGVNAIDMAFECRDPSSCSAILVNINGGVSTNIAGNPMGAIGSYTPVSLDFGDATDSTASFVMNYADAGQIQLHARYNIPLDDGTGTPSSIYMLGSSNAFVVRPFGFDLDFNGDRAANGITGASYATDSSGSIFQLAGATFDTSLTAVAWSGADDTNNDGVPDACANLTDNAVTANFGNETAAVIPSGVTLSQSLVEPSAGGVPGALTISANSAAFVAGTGSKTIAWSEVGIMDLNASLADYLGSGQAVQGNVCNVGRFYPKDFVIANATVTNRSDIALCADPFTYMDENFKIDFDLQAYNAATPAAITQNYIGAFAKLDPTAIGAMNYGATDSGTDYTARLGVSSAGAFTGGAAPVTATLALAKNAAPDGLYANMEIGIAPADGDGVALRTLDLSLNGGASTHGKLGQTDIRYGRLILQNNFGSELLPLTMPLLAQHYLNGTTGFVTNTNDNCTSLTTADVLLYNDQAPKTGRALGNTVVNVSGAATTTLTGVSAFANGASSLNFSAPGAEGYVDAEVQTPAYLLSDIDGIDQGVQGPGMHCTPGLAVSDPAYIAGCAADGNTVDDVPRARGSFGIFKGSDRVIYIREVY